MSGDDRNVDKFRAQLEKYRDLVEDRERHEAIVDSYHCLFEQRQELFKTENFDGVDWKQVRANQPVLFLLMNGYDAKKLAPYLKLGNDFQIRVFASNRMMPLSIGP